MALKNPFDNGIAEPEFDNRNETTSEIVPVPKRGRPSKTAPVYDENGTLILSSEDREYINTLVDGIRSCQNKIEGLLQTAAQKHFALGHMLYEVEKKTVGRMTAAKYEAYTGVPARLVHTAMKIYKTFAENPEALQTMTMREIAALISEKKELPGSETNHVKYSIPSSNDSAELVAESFGLPTLSGVLLENYRIHTDVDRGTVYLLDKQTCGAIPVASLSVSQPGNDAKAKAAYQVLMADTQKAFERYYSVMEKEEDDG